jgi:hypothetical protein
MKFFSNLVCQSAKMLVALSLLSAVSLGAVQAPPLMQSYGDVPLAFEPNQGQAQKNVRFVARARGMTLLLRDDLAQLTIANPNGRSGSSQISTIDMQFIGARFSGEPSALDPLKGISNYLIGSDRSHWHTGIPNFGKVRYTDVYPGVDLVFYGNHRQLEHDFVVAPGANYRQIRVHLDGIRNVEAAPDGSLVVNGHSGDLTFRAPGIYQTVRGKKVTIKGRYRMLASNEFGFEISGYDRRLPLVIDPVLSYSTYLAGTSSDTALAVAVDSAGDAYLTGYTFSTDFPVQGPEQPACNSACSQPDTFVTKFNPSGSALVYSTYVGGSGYDQGSAITVDSAGNALVAGYTSSFDFPQKNGLTVVLGFGSNHGCAFSLNSVGSDFNFSTYLGGESMDAAMGITSDASANVYVSGYTGSANFIVTPGNQIGPSPSYFNSDLFLAKLTSTGGLIYSTLIGGTSTGSSGTFGYYPPEPISVAVNSQGEALLTGAAWDGFPTTPNAFQPNYPGINTGSYSAFLGRLNSTGTALLYGTYLGGSGTAGGDGATQVALDSAENVYVTGTTGSLDFPTTRGAFQATNIQGGQISFVTKMDPTLSKLAYSTYLGATQTGYGGGVISTGIAVDKMGNAYVSGNTNNSLFPLVNPLVGQPPQSIYGSSNTAFLSVLNPHGTALTFSTFFSGSVSTTGAGVALDVSGNPYITGSTWDPDLPTTSGAFQSTIPAPPYPVPHAFLTKFSVKQPNAGSCLSSSSLYFPPTEPGKTSYPVPITITNCGTLTLKISSVMINNPVFVLGTHICHTIAPGGTCSMSVRYSPTINGNTDLGTLQITDNAPIPTQNVLLSGYSALPSILIYATELALPDEILGLTSAPALAQVQTYGALPLHITSVTATGDFTGVNQCPKALQPGQACFLGATFTPTGTGTRTGTLSIYDDAPGSPQTLALTGNGLGSYPAPVITFMSPGSALTGSAAIRLQILGNEFFPTSTVTVNGTTVPSKIGPYGDMLATIPATFLKKVGNLAIQVVNPAPGGASLPVGFSVYSLTALGAADVVYEPFTQKYYASLPSNSPANPNTLVTIDPATGVMGTPIPIKNNPGALGLSSDGMVLYVSLNGNNSVVPFNVMTQTVGAEIPLGSDPLKGSLTASNLQVQPGNSANFAATLTAGYYGQDGIDWIQNGAVVSQFLNEPPTSVAVGGSRFVDGTNLFGWNANYGAWGLLHFVITGKGMLETSGIGGAFGLGAFDTDGTNLYDVNGQVFNASTGALIGTISPINNYPEAAVLTDTSSGRTFFLNQYDGGVLAFDSLTLAQVGTINSLPVTSPANRLQHWGLDGLSILTYNYGSGGYDLLLLRTGLFYPALGPNPSPVAKSLNPSSVTAQGPNFTLTVNGSQFVQGAAVLWNGVYRTTKWITSSKLVADIPASDIVSSGQAKITVFNPAPGGGKSISLNFDIN